MAAVKPGLCAYCCGQYSKEMVGQYLYKVKNKKLEEPDEESEDHQPKPVHLKR